MHGCMSFTKTDAPEHINKQSNGPFVSVLELDGFVKGPHHSVAMSSSIQSLVRALLLSIESCAQQVVPSVRVRLINKCQVIGRRTTLELGQFLLEPQQAETRGTPLQPVHDPPHVAVVTLVAFL
mmetsp:Transcript_35094/g.87415  ORF Transcript_35094/g.87415 Transcript_35094/m.87415 type:complete len:124 (-) Transcript_35094:2481-2852(-)